MFVDNLIGTRLSHMRAAGDQIHFAPDAKQDALDLMQPGDLGHSHVECLVDAEDIVFLSGLAGKDLTQFDNIFLGRNFAEAADNETLQGDPQHPDFNDRVVVENREAKTPLGNDFNHAFAEQVEHGFSDGRPRNAEHFGEGRLREKLPLRYLSIADRSSDRVIGLLGQTLCAEERWHGLHLERSPQLVSDPY